MMIYWAAMRRRHRDMRKTMTARITERVFFSPDYGASYSNLVETLEPLISVRVKDERQSGAKDHSTIRTGGKGCKASGKTCAMARECY